MNGIYRTFSGNYIDIDKVISINSAIEQEANNNTFVYLKFEFLLRDTPLIVSDFHNLTEMIPYADIIRKAVLKRAVDDWHFYRLNGVVRNSKPLNEIVIELYQEMF